jgi:hypothetical protein
MLGVINHPRLQSASADDISICLQADTQRQSAGQSSHPCNTRRPPISEAATVPADTSAMNNDPRLIDDALETATERTKSAQEDFVETPPVDEEAVMKAAKVRRRAEDLSILAEDAVDGEIGGDR